MPIRYTTEQLANMERRGEPVQSAAQYKSNARNVSDNRGNAAQSSYLSPKIEDRRGLTAQSNYLAPTVEDRRGARARADAIQGNNTYNDYVRGDAVSTGQRFQSPNSGFITDSREKESGKIKFPLNTNNQTQTNAANATQSTPKSFEDEMNEEASALRRTLMANGIFTPQDMKMNDYFYRYPRNDPFNYVDGAREYLFFTKPDLPLVDGNTGTSLIKPANTVPYFVDLWESPGYKKAVFANLCAHAAEVALKDKCPFMRILSNRKTSNMDVPDIQVDELETAVNMFGTKILYPKSSMASDEGVDFSIEFEDTRFAEIYHLWKTYDIYRQLKWMGVLGPTVNQGRDDLKDAKTAYEHYNTYGYHKILHDHFSVYKFLIESDGMTILHMSKATGVFARSISRSAFSEIQDRGPLKITIGFKVSGWYEDSNPLIVSDFNNLIWRWIGYNPAEEKTRGVAAPIYDQEIGYVSQELVEVPYIVKVPHNYTEAGVVREGPAGRDQYFSTYKLLWLKSK